MSEIPHGTAYGYNRHRCRCQLCRDAKNRQARERGYNRRTGKRGEQKRAADIALKHPCAGCGQMVYRAAELCRACENDRRRATRRRIQVLWLDGRTHREIAQDLGTTTNVVGSTLALMRGQGWNVPRRGPGGRILELA